jgi:hypothetical protein
MQHPDLQHTFKRAKTFENIYLQHTCIVIATYANPKLFLQYPDETFATYI